MPIFGQVWLWSSLAFLLGALLCWLLVARPARNRVGELEAQLASPARRPSAPDRPELDRRRDDQGVLAPGIGDDEDFRTRSFGLRDTPPPLPPERGRLAPYVDQERDFPPPAFDAPSEHDVEQPPAAATQYLDVSSGSLAAPPEVPAMSPPPSDRGWFDDELEGDAADKAPEEQPAVPRNRHQLIEPFDARLVDDDADESDIASALSDDEPRSAVADESGGTVFTQRTHPIPGELIRQIDEAGKEERARAEADNLVDDLAEDPAETEFDRRERTVESEAVAPPSGFDEPRFTEPESSPQTFTGQEPTFTEPERSAFTEPESSAPVFTEPERSTPTFSETDRPAAAFTEPEGSAPSFGEQAPAFGEQPAPSFGDTDRPAFTEPAGSTPSFGRLAPASAATSTEPSRPAHALNDPVAPTFDEQAPAFTEPEASAPEPLQQEQTEIVAATAPATEEPATREPGTRSASNLPKRVPQQNRITQAVSVRVDPTPTALPKRVPSKPRHQVPFGVEPSSTPEPVAPAATDQPAEPARSLFEPIVPAEDEGMSTPPPPHRLRQGSGGGRGPFGPGSAMPLPGGASPSPEFTIKASVAALRYCTPESPQFGRTVAEVWFRTAADAERVGFRPVG